MAKTYPSNTFLGESRRAVLLKHLREQLENKRMIYSKDQIQLSTTVGQGKIATIDIHHTVLLQESVD